MGLLLLDIHLLVISAVILGAKDREGFEDLGHLKIDCLKWYRPFKAGILESKNSAG